jgi:hypothetical protein
MSITSITAAAMLGSINISVWEARKQDKKTAEEVAVSKGARSKRAATVHKHLFSECPALEAIKSLRGEVRQWFNTVTLPWDDNGRRLITVAQYLDITSQAAKYEQRFNALVRAFIGTYSTEISKQAFEMGALFDRSEYPHEDEVAAKFRFSYVIEPLPMSGDFRVDIGNEAKNQLAEQYERQIAERVSGAVADAWERVKTQVEWVRERMDAVLAYDPDQVEEIKTTDDAGTVVSVEIKKKRRPKLYDSMLEQGLALTDLLKDLNVTNDPRLEEARRDLETALSRIDIDSLRESPELQRSTKTAMQDILDKFAL